MSEFSMNEVEASQGDFFALGVRYACGHKVEIDLVTAHKWFNIAAIKGNREAAERRAELAGEMTAQQIANAQRAAREWLRLH